MTELTAASRKATPRLGSNAPLALMLAVVFALQFLSLVIVSAISYSSHVGFNADWPHLILAPIFLTVAIGSAFVFATFSFGYFAGFYLFTMMSGYFWLNAFSVLPYDHSTALISATTSMVLFLLPALLLNTGARFPVAIPERLFRLMPEAILCFAVFILAISAARGFHFGGLFSDLAVTYRNEFAQSRGRLLEYAIGNVTGALIPFAFACLLLRKRWAMLAALCVVSMLFYPITLNKTTFFVAPYLIFVATVSRYCEARATVVLTIFLPLAFGLLGFALNKDSMVFQVINLRMIAVPSMSLEHYFSFFSTHPLTHFCQISFFKPLMACPYSDQLGAVLGNEYKFGNMNASLFATEGIASVGPLFAPVSAFVCGLVIAFGNKASSDLPPRFILVSAAIVTHSLLDVPLSTTLLTNGLGLLMLLWALTPASELRVDLAKSY